MSNALAVRLDRAGEAEMSCIAGVGGHVRKLVKTARAGRPILALDGCHLACVKACLAQHGIEAENHVVLSDLGIKKSYGQDFDPQEADRIYPNLTKITAALHQGEEPS
jgi:uncharacterized metal-binding protein